MINALVEEARSGGAQQVYDNYRSLGRHYADGKWKPVIDRSGPFLNEDTRAGYAILLEQTDRAFNQGGILDETIRTANVGSFDKYAFPMIRAIYPELAAQELVSVQPMLAQTSMIFYLDYVHGTTRGNVTRGQSMFSSVARGPDTSAYTSGAVNNEIVPSIASIALSHGPIIPQTVEITDGMQTVTDDGNGNLVGDGSGTIDYATGTGAVTFAQTSAAGTTVLANYVQDLEANSDVPEMDLIIHSAPITAQTRKIRINWAAEAGFNLRAMHGLEIEAEAVAGLAAKIRFDIDRQIINDLRRIAASSSGFFIETPVSGAGSGFNVAVDRTQHKLNFIEAIETMSMNIWQTTGRGHANWIVCGRRVATMVKTLPGFVPTPNVPSTLQKGIYKMGVLNGEYSIFADPYIDARSFVMGLKGDNFFDTGYVYAPYVPIFATPTIMLDDFKARKGLGTMYGVRPINALFYATGKIGTPAELAADTGGKVAASVFEGLGKPFGLANELSGISGSGKGVFV